MSAAGSSGGFGSLGHLAVRFFGSLRRIPPPVADEAWARRWLNAGETALWARQSNPDRRHAVEVAHTAAEMLGDRDGAGVPGEVIAAALLHDVGKIEAGLGTFGRVAATLATGLLGRPRVVSWAGAGAGGEAEAPEDAAGAGVPAEAPVATPAAGVAGAGVARTRAGGATSDWRARAGRYVTHDKRGARLLAEAGSAPFVVTWTAEHHQPADTWTLDPVLTYALKEADGD